MVGESRGVGDEIAAPRNTIDQPLCYERFVYDIVVYEENSLIHSEHAYNSKLRNGRLAASCVMIDRRQVV